MSKRSPDSKRSKSPSTHARKGRGVKSSGISKVIDDLRQCAFPVEFRIALPSGSVPAEVAPSVSADPPSVGPRSISAADLSIVPIALAEIGTCLWYLKTRHFKREWLNQDTADDDPRTRRTLGRLSKGLDALKRCGIEVEDPIGRRYAAGSEAMMKPLDFAPTEGLTYDKVIETVTPLVYFHGRIIQRAEVFVAVPPASAETPVAPSEVVAERGGTPVEGPAPATTAEASCDNGFNLSKPNSITGEQA